MVATLRAGPGRSGNVDSHLISSSSFLAKSCRWIVTPAAAPCSMGWDPWILISPVEPWMIHTKAGSSLKGCPLRKVADRGTPEETVPCSMIRSGTSVLTVSTTLPSWVIATSGNCIASCDENDENSPRTKFTQSIASEMLSLQHQPFVKLRTGMQEPISREQEKNACDQVAIHEVKR